MQALTNYLVIAFAQTRAPTPAYGFAVHTSAMVAEILLALLWLWVAWKGRLRLSFRDAPRWRWLLLPFALLVFWSPLTVEGMRVALKTPGSIFWSSAVGRPI